MAEEERDMQELQQLMATLEQGWKEEAAAQPAAPPTHSPQLQQLSGMLEAERLARRAAEADRDELRRQAEATAAEASALVKNSARLRAEFEALRGAAGGEAETRVVLQAQRDQLAAELSASYEHRTALQRVSGTTRARPCCRISQRSPPCCAFFAAWHRMCGYLRWPAIFHPACRPPPVATPYRLPPYRPSQERDALAEQLWHAGERSAAFEPEKAALEARVRAAEDTAARLQGEMDGLRRELEEARAARAAAEQERDTLQHQHQHQLRSVAEPAGQLRAERDALADLLAAARQQLTAAQAEVQRLQEEARLAAQNAKVLRSLGLLLASMD
jgi:septal ring factor EnvC (AmiA/AmiB activator)